MHLQLFIDHTYVFQSPSATIFRVYSIKDYNKWLKFVFVKSSYHGLHQEF